MEFTRATMIMTIILTIIAIIVIACYINKED